MLPTSAQVAGSSMEPALRGPRVHWMCPLCQARKSFTIDSWKAGSLFRCPACNEPNVAPEVDVITDAEAYLSQGEMVQIQSIRALQLVASSKSGKPAPIEQCLRRGDIIALRDSLPISEAKRLVGFPGERIQIRDGDIWVNGVRFEKTLLQYLEQAVVVDYWNKSQQKKHSFDWFNANEDRRIDWPLHLAVFEATPIDQSLSLRFTLRTAAHLADRSFLDNRLDLNSHDQHQFTRVDDVGLAMAFSAMSDPWSLRVWCNEATSSDWIDFVCNGRKIQLSRGSKEQTDPIQVSDSIEITAPIAWLIVARVDGKLRVGSSTEEWQSWDASPIEKDSFPLLQWEWIAGECSVDQIVLMRDLQYRGARDEAYQAWQASGCVVLGDNISISDDCRSKWPDGVPLERIRGRVIPPRAGFQAILGQIDLQERVE